MVAFFEQTWLLWWMVGVVAILRWFHIASAGDAWEDPAPQQGHEESLPASARAEDGKALPTQCPAGMRTLR